MAEGQYKFGISLDDKQFKEDVSKASREFDKLAAAAEKAGRKIDKSVGNPFDKIEVPAALPQKTEQVTRSFNGLNMATQQLVRETPALAMGMNTFFLAISNNLPIFVDQIKQVSAANKELASQGKATTSVFKQVMSSLLSWQTALMVGITLLSTFASKLFSSNKESEKAKSAADAEAEARERLNKAISDQEAVMTSREKAMRDEYIAVNKLVEQYADAATSEEQRYRILQKLKDLAPSVVSGINDEAEAIGTLRDNLKEYNEERLVQMSLAHVESEETRIIEENAKAQADLAAAEARLIAAQQAVVNAGGKGDYHPYREDIQKSKAAGKFDKFIKENNIPANANKALTTENYREIAELVKDQSFKWTGLKEEVSAASVVWGVAAELESEFKKTAAEYAAIYDDALAKQEKFNSELAAWDSAREKILADAKAVLGDDFTLDGGDDTTEADLTQKIDEFTKKLYAEAIKAKIEARKDGLSKTLAQIDYEYATEMAAIKEREQELKTARGGKLTDDDIAAFKALRRAAAAERYTKTDAAWAELEEERVKLAEETEELINEEYERLNEAKEAWNEYLMEYGTFQERLMATQQYYQDKIAAAENEGERRALMAERDAILAQYEVEASGFAKELMGKTTEELNKMLESMQKLVEEKQAAFDALDSSNSQEAQEYLRTINILNAQIAELKKQVKGAGEAVATDDWAQAVQVMQNISSAASKAATELSKVDESAGKTMGSIASLAGMATNLVGAIKAVKTATDAVGTVSGVLGIISVAVQAVSSIVGGIVKQQKEMEATIKAFKELNYELERMRNAAQINSVGGTIFGDDAFGNFSNNIQVLKEAIAAYGKAQQAVIERGKELVNQTDETGLGYTINTVNHVWKNIADSLGNMKVLIKDYGKFAEAWGARDKYSTLGEQLPGVFGEDGEVTLEALKALQSSEIYDQISQENRDLIDELVDEWQHYEDATAAVTDYLSGIFGNLGNEINDAIVNAFMNGTDAAEAFGKSATAMLENLIKQIGYTAYIAPILTDAMTKVDALNHQGLSAEEYLEQLMGIVRDTMEAAERESANLAEFYERSDREAEEMGFDTFNRERAGATKGIAQASQDSVDELNGRMTAVQGHTYALVQGQRQLINDSAQALNYLAGIERNTYELHQIRSDMGAMRRDINNIATRGIVTR